MSSELGHDLFSIYFLAFQFYFLCGPGTKLKDFVATLQLSDPIQSKITKLRHEVEEYAKQFPTIGFEKESMKYKI